MMIDSAFSVVSGNVVQSDDRTNNRLDETDGPWTVYRKSSSYPAFDDLPNGGSTIVAFELLQRPESPGTTVANVIDANELRAACTSGCVGVGYFQSRGTGLDSAGNFSDTMVNTFTRNNPYGSNIGSVRCGVNAFAIGDTCDGTFPSGNCNGDDHQHTGFLRLDGCEDY
jgi:hypothetical protein